jgi:hypothetical protein
MLVNMRRTKEIGVAIFIFLLCNVIILTGGVFIGNFDGIYFVLWALVFGYLAQMGWLWMRTKTNKDRIRD